MAEGRSGRRRAGNEERKRARAAPVSNQPALQRTGFPRQSFCIASTPAIGVHEESYTQKDEKNEVEDVGLGFSGRNGGVRVLGIFISFRTRWPRRYE